MPRSLIVAGDFNAPGVDWETLTVKPEGPLKGMCARLIEILGSNSLQQLVHEPTRQKAILDLFCMNKPGLVKNVSVIPGISDHDGVVVVDTALRATINKKPRRKIQLWSKADWDKIREEAVLFSDSFCAEYNCRNVQQNYEALSDFLKGVTNSVPSKLSSTRYNVPWLTPEIKKLCRKKRRVYKKAKAGSTRHQTLFKKLQNETRDALRKAHWEHVNGLLKDSQETGESRKFWKYIKSKKQDSQGVAPLRTNGQLLADSAGKAQALSDQFCSVFTRDTPETADLRAEGPSYPPILDLHINTPGIAKLLQGLNPSKASGPDEIPGRLLKCLANELAPAITCLFRQSISTGMLPKEWKSAWITPVFKKGSRSDPANYRPVSLTCILCKLLEHVICTHIRGHLDKHGILTPANHGFRSRHSCETQLLLTTHDLIQERDLGKQVDVAILDFSKAFDTVPHQRLLGKLEFYGITGELRKWIESFLVGRKQSVVVDGVRSADEDVLSGVPQGTVLGPLLFLIHINDLPEVIDPRTKCRLFADDCLLYRSIETSQDQVELQNDLAKLEIWAENWGMRFNAKKCYVMPICRGRDKKDHMYELCGSILQAVSDEKYLGILISNDLSWGPHIQNTATTANQKLGFLMRNLKGCPKDLKRLSYISMVRSGLEYASTIWDPHQANHKQRLERTQRKAARWISSDYKRHSSITSMLSKLNLESLEDRRRDARLVLLYKILNEQVAVDLPMDELGFVRSPRATRGLYTKDKLLVPQ